MVLQDGDYKTLMYGDGRGTCGTHPALVHLNRLYSFTAMMENPNAKDVLVISMGCGNTAAGFAKFPIRSLDIVDLSQGAFDAATYFPTNDGILNDPRVHTYVEDGRNFLKRSTKHYDIIELELPSLYTAASSTFTRKNFIRFCQRV